MAFLMDLPPAARRELAARWGAEESTDLLYRTMTDPAHLSAAVDALGPGARSVLVHVARGSGAVDDLLARLPISRERLGAQLDGLGALGLVLRQPIGDGPPRLARAPFGGEPLYVPADVAAVLAGG